MPARCLTCYTSRRSPHSHGAQASAQVEAACLLAMFGSQLFSFPYKGAPTGAEATKALKLLKNIYLLPVYDRIIAKYADWEDRREVRRCHCEHPPGVAGRAPRYRRGLLAILAYG